jgi:hypothetical protein
VSQAVDRLSSSNYHERRLAKFRKASISFVIPVCLPVCIHTRLRGTTQLPLDGLS